MHEIRWAIFNRTKIGQINKKCQKKNFRQNPSIAPLKTPLDHQRQKILYFPNIFGPSSNV